MMFASFWVNFNQKLANVPPGQNVGRYTPPNLGGLVGVWVGSVVAGGGGRLVVVVTGGVGGWWWGVGGGGWWWLVLGGAFSFVSGAASLYNYFAPLNTRQGWALIVGLRKKKDAIIYI